MRLWLRVAAVVAAVAVASLLLTGLVAMRVAAEASTVTAIRAQERDAAAVAASVGRWLDDRESTLMGWALGFPVAELDRERRDGLTRVVLSAIPSAVVVTLVDGDGRAVAEPAYFLADEAPAGALASDPTGAERLRRALPITAALASPRGAAFGRPSVDAEGRASVPVAVVASNDPPLLLGVQLALDIVDELRAQTSEEHAVGLLDGEGVVLAGRGHPLIDPRRVGALLGTVASVSYTQGDVRVRGAVAPVPGVGWSVVVLEPEQVALEGAARIRRLLPMVVGAAMALATLLGLVLGRTVTEPIARLRDTALAIADGRFGARASVSGPPEVGELARAFNHMSERLRDNQAEIHRQREAIEAFNEDLQREVEAATAELRGAQQQLIRSGQLAAVAQIGAGLAHELNNPLTAVMGLAQVLRAREPEGPHREELDALVREAERCREVVGAMVRLTQPAVEDADARGTVADVVAQLELVLQPVFRQRHVRLDVLPAPNGGADLPAAALSRAVGQLLTGFAASLPEGASVRVRAAFEEDAPVLWLEPSAPVGSGSDDWMASGVDVWVARQTLDRLGASLLEPIDDAGSWQVRLVSR